MNCRNPPVSISRLSEVAGARLRLVSTGPDREQTILHVNPFAD